MKLGLDKVIVTVVTDDTYSPEQNLVIGKKFVIVTKMA